MGEKMAKKKKQPKKTNEERILDDNHIVFSEMQFDWLSGKEKALKQVKEAGLNEESILKTIVCLGSDGPKDYLVVCLPIISEIDLKMVARELGKKQIHLADNKKLIKITGYIHGANTPIGIHAFKDFPIYFDQRIKDFPEVCVSAGKVGRSVRIKLNELVGLVDGHFIQVSDHTQI